MECCRIVSPLASGALLNINTSDVDDLAASLKGIHFHLLTRVGFVLVPLVESHTCRCSACEQRINYLLVVLIVGEELGYFLMFLIQIKFNYKSTYS